MGILRHARRLIIHQDDFHGRRLAARAVAARGAEGDAQDHYPVEQRRPKERRHHAVAGGRKARLKPSLKYIGSHAASRVLAMAPTSIAPMSTACALFSSRIPVGLVTLISVM